jgi:hypothetical protein
MPRPAAKLIFFADCTTQPVYFVRQRPLGERGMRTRDTSARQARRRIAHRQICALSENCALNDQCPPVGPSSGPIKTGDGDEIDRYHAPQRNWRLALFFSHSHPRLGPIFRCRRGVQQARENGGMSNRRLNRYCASAKWRNPYLSKASA